MLTHAALLATDARRRLNGVDAQTKPEATHIRAVWLWHCPSGGRGNTSH